MRIGGKEGGTGGERSLTGRKVGVEEERTDVKKKKKSGVNGEDVMDPSPGSFIGFSSHWETCNYAALRMLTSCCFWWCTWELDGAKVCVCLCVRACLCVFNHQQYLQMAMTNLRGEPWASHYRNLCMSCAWACMSLEVQPEKAAACYNQWEALQRCWLSHKVKWFTIANQMLYDSSCPKWDEAQLAS